LFARSALGTDGRLLTSPFEKGELRGISSR
jgi:hypothetical protein